MLFVGAQLLLQRDHPLVFKIFAEEIYAPRSNNSTFDIAPKYPMPKLGSSLHYCQCLLTFNETGIAKSKKIVPIKPNSLRGEGGKQRIFVSFKIAVLPKKIFIFIRQHGFFVF